MFDLTEDFLLEHRLEARVARLTIEVDSLIRLDSNRLDALNSLLRDLNTLKQRQNDLIYVVNGLTRKYANFVKFYEESSEKIIINLNAISRALRAHDQIIDELSLNMENLSIK